MSSQGLATEALFGPPSEPIKIDNFVHEVEQSSHRVLAQSADLLGDVAQKEWTALSGARRASIEAECRYVLPSYVSFRWSARSQLQIFSPSFRAISPVLLMMDAY